MTRTDREQARLESWRAWRAYRDEFDIEADEPPPTLRQMVLDAVVVLAGLALSFWFWVQVYGVVVGLVAR